MNFEPADPPLLDPYILEQFTEEEIQKKDQAMRHKYVLKKLADFIPSKNKKKNQPFLKSAFSPNISQHKQSQMCPAPSQELPLKIKSSTSILQHNIFPPSPTSHPNTRRNLSSLSSLSSTEPVSSLQSAYNSPLSLHSHDVKSISGVNSSCNNVKSNGNGGVNSVTRPRATKRFSYLQSVVLEEFFQKYGSARIADRVALAQQLGLYKNDVIGWFQSRRRKERRAHTLNASSEEMVCALYYS